MATLHEILMVTEDTMDAIHIYSQMFINGPVGILERPYTQAVGMHIVADWLVEDVEIDADTEFNVQLTARIPVVNLIMELTDEIPAEILDIFNDPKMRPPEVLTVRVDKPNSTITFVVGPGPKPSSM